ncbi:conserved hypothetical protein [Roseibium sp. TrichSKD4]|uniref:hypothetical protein n=1 Tax=Roseibium sp. TrichSKD4 TaxID=744980 RepID=UPI0001E56B87|nr:hypothetical protein [Roseibium sp. TrichSKD4]EFO32612.1 conserved hypothetical protein [Roseibium sp. TrichSKD4]
MKDIHSELTRKVAIGAAVHSASLVGAIVDLQDHNAAEILVDIGVGGIVFSDANKIELKLEHSQDGSEFNAVTDTDVLGIESVEEGGVIKAFSAEHAAAGVYRCGYKGGERYLRLSADFSGSHGAGTPFSASILLGHGYSQPEDNQA